MQFGRAQWAAHRCGAGLRVGRPRLSHNHLHLSRCGWPRRDGSAPTHFQAVPQAHEKLAKNMIQVLALVPRRSPSPSSAHLGALGAMPFHLFRLLRLLLPTVPRRSTLASYLRPSFFRAHFSSALLFCPTPASFSLSSRRRFSSLTVQRGARVVHSIAPNLALALPYQQHERISSLIHHPCLRGMLEKCRCAPCSGRC